LAWFYDPIYFGDYPQSMRDWLGQTGDRLPKFNKTMKALLKNSTDFFGFNHYGTGFGYNSPVDPKNYTDHSYFSDARCATEEKDLPRA